MYYPYLRGKQYELLLLRELFGNVSSDNVLPVLEPVKSNLSGVIKVLEAAKEANFPLILVVNPCLDEFELEEGRQQFQSELVDKLDSEYPNVIWGFMVSQSPDFELAQKVLGGTGEREVALIHYTSQVSSEFYGLALDSQHVSHHIFIEEYAQRRYRRKYPDSDAEKVLIRDGFKKRNSNREYPPEEHFSELHLTFEDEGVTGFGDFLISGEGYSTSGGPAYAIAIHVTFLDPADEDDMYIKHYVSDRTSDPLDPGGKFQEALGKLVEDLEREESYIFRSGPMEEFLLLHEKDHYPGLGYVKKLSMKHHVELMLSYLAS